MSLPMHCRAVALLLVLIGLTPADARPVDDEAPASLELWAVDPLEKVFRDASPRAWETPVADVATGEHATWQLVVRCERAIEDLRVDVGAFVNRGPAPPASLPRASARFVGYVGVDRPTPRPAGDRLREPPALFPDPLLEI